MGRRRHEQPKPGKTERGARKDHKRLFYCVNVNCTSLDHLLLGGSADIDKMSNDASITPDEREAGVFPLARI